MSDVRHIYICEVCGSPDVGCDAAVWWDVEKQDWQLGDLLDDDWCSNCGGETSMDRLDSTLEEHPVGKEVAASVKSVGPVWSDWLEPDIECDSMILRTNSGEVYYLQFETKVKPAEVLPKESIVILQKVDEFFWMVKE